jgi:predicted DNA-binding WGR domain protein
LIPPIEPASRNPKRLPGVCSSVNFAATKGATYVKIPAALCLLACLGSTAFAQDEDELTAKARILPTIGPGLRSVRIGPNGNTYVLSAPNSYVAVFGKDGKLVKNVPAYAEASGPASQELRSIRFGESMDVDASGTVYVADRAANAVKIWDAAGNARMAQVNAPLSVAALPDGEVAVSTLHEPHLVMVFDKNGRDVREFGDPEALTDRADLNRFLNIGQLATDAQGHLFYAFAYTQEPTVRQYDRFGYAGQDMLYTALEAAPAAQAIRREIQRQEKKSGAPIFKRVLTAVGVERDTGEVWMAVGNNLLRFDKEGTRRAGYKLYTPEGARLEPNLILVDKDRLMIGSDPLGIYVFERPDKKTPQ